MVYFAYGAMGLTAVAQRFWIKNSLTRRPAELAGLASGSLPWTVKMVFGELVDAVPLLGHSAAPTCFRRGLIAASLLLMAGAAGGWLTLLAGAALRARLVLGRTGLSSRTSPPTP